MKKLISSVCVSLFLVTSSYSTIFDERPVFVSGTEGYGTYRIPAIIRAGNGDLLAFCEGRVNGASDFGNIDIVMKRSTDNGLTWGALQVVATNGNVLAGNPGPVVDTMDPQHPNRVWLSYNKSAQSEANVRSGLGVREVMVMHSDNHGATWSTPENITVSVHKPNEPSFNPAYTFSEDWRWYAIAPGHCIQLKSGPHAGRLLFPSNHQEGGDITGNYSSHAFYSDDHGLTWQVGGKVGPGTNESIAVELANGDVMVNTRNFTGTTRSVAFSADGGESWTGLFRDAELIEPRCQGSLIRYSMAGKNRILFSNPATTSSRTRGTVRMSYDEGEAWSVSRQIYAGSFAYSDLVTQSDGQIGLLYERDSYGSIYYARFDLEWLSFGSDTDAPPATGTYVMNGSEMNVLEYGGTWMAGSGFVYQSGTSKYMWAGNHVPAGDFTVTAQLQLSQLNGTAASFQIGDHHFGFDGGGNVFFTEGGGWALTTHGSSSTLITPNQTFTFEAVRTGNQIAFTINGTTVVTKTISTSAMRIGLRPWRNTMRVFNFSSVGNLPEQPISVSNDAEVCGATVLVAAVPVTGNNSNPILRGVRSDGLPLTDIYPVGETIITWAATDNWGNTATATQMVTVNDTEAPVLTVGQVISVPNDAGVCGATINITAATATDNCSVPILKSVRNDGLPLTAIYPMGNTTITWTATDSTGNTSTSTQVVTVNDTEAPVLVVGQDISVTNDAGVCGASIDITATATDNCSGSSLKSVRSDGLPLTDIYPVGKTTITWTATDATGNTATTTQAVTVNDKEAPVLVGTGYSPELWPPNHEYHQFNIAQFISLVSDNCSGIDASNAIILSITSDEAEYAPGSGDTGNDILIEGAQLFSVRAERSGNGDGRVYTVHISVADDSGNKATMEGTISVPKSKNKAAVRGSSAYSVNAGRVATSARVASIDSSQTAEEIGSFSTSMYPNPASNIAKLRITSDEEAVCRLTVMDLNTKVLQAADYKLIKGTNEVELDACDLKSGVYFVSITTQNRNETIKLIIKK
jgi:sialidase-1